MTERRIKSRMLYSYLNDPSAVAGSIILLVFLAAAVLTP